MSYLKIKLQFKNYYHGEINKGIKEHNIDEMNKDLESLNKPKIVFYTFPEFTDNPYLPKIDDLSLKYPLKNQPYLSRESKNTFYQNTNLIDFIPQHILQASELNELQEKFYKKQSLYIKYVSNYFNKNNINKKYDDILGLSTTVSSSISNILNQKNINCNKILPFNFKNIKINIDPNAQNLYKLTVTSDSFLINTNSFVGDLFSNTVTSNKISNIDFLNIDTSISIPFDSSSMKESILYCISLNVDLSNIINCNQYQDLKDNSGGSVQNSPCGASRNLLSLQINNEFSQFNYDLNNKYGIPTTQQFKSPINNAATNLNIPHLLVVAKKENGLINFYYANGIKIQN